jgi:hypothetical protein
MFGCPRNRVNINASPFTVGDGTPHSLGLRKAFIKLAPALSSGDGVGIPNALLCLIGVKFDERPEVDVLQETKHQAGVRQIHVGRSVRGQVQQLQVAVVVIKALDAIPAKTRLVKAGVSGTQHKHALTQERAPPNDPRHSIADSVSNVVAHKLRAMRFQVDSTSCASA